MNKKAIEALALQASKHVVRDSRLLSAELAALICMQAWVEF